MTEKQASSEIAQSRKRFRKFLVDQQWPFSRQAVIAAMEWAEQGTRERCAQLLMDAMADNGYWVWGEKLVERIRGKE